MTFSRTNLQSSLRRRLRLAALAAGVAAFSGFAATAQAEVIDYTFAPDAGYSSDGLDGQLIDSARISGTFSWDTSALTITSSNIDVTGFSGTAFAGPYHGEITITDGLTVLPGSLNFAIDADQLTYPGLALYITFARSLSLGGRIDLTPSILTGDTAQWFCASGFQNAAGYASTGAVPEPSSWAMMLLGLAGLGFAGRARNKKKAALGAA